MTDLGNLERESVFGSVEKEKTNRDHSNESIQITDNQNSIESVLDDVKLNWLETVGVHANKTIKAE